MNCGQPEQLHRDGYDPEFDCPGFRDEPSDDEMANRPGVEGGIAYGLESAF